jgi:four helix bundle protein
MLRIYDDMLDVIRMLKPMVAIVAKHDGDLAGQMKRAASSACLNLAEGSGCNGARRRNHYDIALGSARETAACIETAHAWGYLDAVPHELMETLRKVINVTVANCHRPR